MKEEIYDLKKIFNLIKRKKIPRRIFLLGMFSVAYNKKHILEKIDEYYSGGHINDADLILGIGFKNTNDIMNQICSLESIPLLASYYHGFQNIRKGPFAYKNMLIL